MQRTLSLLLILALCFTLCACGRIDGNISENTPGMSEGEKHTEATPNEQTTVSATDTEIAASTAGTESIEAANATEITETIHTHSWELATCTIPKTCSTCGATEGIEKGHCWEDASCTTPKVCTDCGITEGSAKDHIWEDATYTAPKICSVCGATEGNPLEIPGKENYHGHIYTGGSSSKKYHYEANCPGKNSHEITWEEAQRRNLGPCGTCVLK